MQGITGTIKRAQIAASRMHRAFHAPLSSRIEHVVRAGPEIVLSFLLKHSETFRNISFDSCFPPYLISSIIDPGSRASQRHTPPSLVLSLSSVRSILLGCSLRPLSDSPSSSTRKNLTYALSISFNVCAASGPLRNAASRAFFVLHTATILIAKIGPHPHA